MRKILAALGLLLLSASGAWAANCNAYPYTFTNGVTADANQVNSNFVSILNCANTSLAHNGANSDITALQALTTPIAPWQGGSVEYVGGTSTGSANAQVVSTTTPSGFALTAGNSIVFTAGYANTGATTLTVGATATANFYRRTTQGVAPMVGGELVAGVLYAAVYDGTEYVLRDRIDTVGEVKAFTAGSAPNGWLLCAGQAVSRTAYSALFSSIGTTYGAGDGSTTFNLPDLRGRVVAGMDNMNGTAANRLTATSGFTTALGATGGDERMQQHNHTINDPGHSHAAGDGPGWYFMEGQVGTSNGYLLGGGSSLPIAGYHGSTATATTNITINNAGLGNSQNVQPTMELTYIIKG